MKPADPQPKEDAAIWNGHTDGVILTCTGAAGIILIWAAADPGTGPSPRELADRAVAQMNLHAGQIGKTPL